MKSKEQIINDSIKLETPPKEYNLLEIQCFLALKQLTIMFYNKQISTENATKTKKQILANYNKQYKEYEFEQEMFQKHIKNIKETETDRIKVRKLINGKGEYANKPVEERICESFDLAIGILQKVFEEEF